MGKPLSNELKGQVERLLDEVIAARKHYEIYDVLVNDIDRPKFYQVMNHYAAFFMPSISANFVAMLMALSNLYDQKNLSLCTVFDQICKNGVMDDVKLDALRVDLEQGRPIIGKVLILRNNVFARLSLKLDTKKPSKKQASLGMSFETRSIGLKVLFSSSMRSLVGQRSCWLIAGKPIREKCCNLCNS